MEISYSAEEKGKGKPLLFLHGYLSSKECFLIQTEYLSRFRRTVALDLPGFGRSPEPPFAFSLDDYVDFVYEAIGERCGGKADIIAHSFGGRIALKLAATRPEAVDRMLLAGCAGMKPKRKLPYYAKTGVYKILRKIAPGLSVKWRDKFASADYLALSPVMRKSFVKIVNEHLEGYLGRISAPTLFVFGSEDKETPLYMARRLNKNVKGSGLAVFEGCGHFCFTEDPLRFNAVAEEFFKR
ncbi:MAG: alpha/beta hydrolase [Clostridia bacterium]|nr:alpha/beta hydrolase [Clostridia bacterium]